MTVEAVPEFQGALVRLSEEAGGAVDRLVPRLGGLTKAEGLSLISDVYPTLIASFLGAAGALTAQWYSEQKALPSAAVFVVEPATLPAAEQLAASGRWGLMQRDPAGALKGSATRSLFNQSRRTVTDNAHREGVRWTRYASANACGFCRMLATRVLTASAGRGTTGLYRSEQSASRAPHKMDAAGHDHCKCLAVPVRSGTYEVPDYVHDWLDDYEAVKLGADNYLRPPGEIARLMEARADERMGRTKRRPGRPRKEKPAPEAPGRDQVRRVEHLTERGADQAEAVAKPLRDRVEAAQRLVNRADEVVGTAAQISSRVKQVTDVADKVLGGAVPVVRDVKLVVDSADKALQTAAQVTGGVSKVTNLAVQTVDDTVGIAHGVKQLADEVGSVLDDATFVALGVRQLLTDAGSAARTAVQDVRGAQSVSELADRIGDAVDVARKVHAGGAALVDEARDVVEAVQGIAQGVREFPEVLRRPVADVQDMARAVMDAVGDVDQAGDDAAALARAVKRLVDAVADWRRAEAGDVTVPPVFVKSERVAPKAIEAGGSDRLPVRARSGVEEPRRPVFVKSERLDVPRAESRALPSAERDAIGAGAVDAEVVDLPEQLALPPGQTRRALPPAAVRNVDDELAKPFGGLAAEPAPPAATKRARKPKRTLDDVERDLNAALEAGDDDLVDKLAAEMDRIEQREQAAAAKAAARAAEREAARAAKVAAVEAERRAQQDRIFELIEQGTDPDVAESDVTGESLDTVRRRNYMLAMQAEGHHGNTFTKVLKQKYYSLVNEAYLAAEDATRGAMIKPQFMGKVDETALWSMSERDARKYMSDEMAAWFDQHGRLTFMAYRQSVLDGHGAWRNGTTEDYLQ